MLLSWSHSPLRHPIPVAKGGRSRSRSGCRVHAYAELTSRGKAVKDHQLVLGSQLGSGSFGEVFKGSYITDKGDEVLPVVLKRVKSKVEVGVLGIRRCACWEKELFWEHCSTFSVRQACLQAPPPAPSSQRSTCLSVL